MPGHELLTEADINRLPPMLFGVIRWKKSIGRPTGAIASGFTVKIEERTPSQWYMGPDGLPDVTPGHWKTVTESASCTQAPDQGDQYVVTFVEADVHRTVLDGQYRVTLAGRWGPGGLPQIIRGYRAVQPLSWRLAIKEHGFHVVEFEVVRRSYALPWAFGG
ncbi:hypothetical protein AYO38_11695 [bacterium SCGC AG-212-C10]|nr:hypothetical protein AYO38_11695 [bacterium SCGC AG-212-C10]